MAENGNGNKKYPTWQWLSALLIAILLSISAWAWNDTRYCIDKKLDKEQYYRDVEQINKRLDDIQGDIKELLKRRQ